MNSMRRQNDRILQEKLPRLLGAQYSTGDQWRNNSRKNEGMEPKEKQYPVLDGTGDKSKVQCCKEQYCIRPTLGGQKPKGRIQLEAWEKEKSNKQTNNIYI